jgi:hypothetical protein
MDDKVQKFFTDHETAVQRWSSRWWASDGWHRLMIRILGIGHKCRNMHWLFAAFAELPRRYQAVVELIFGIGCGIHRMSEIAGKFPRGDCREGCGVSPERVRSMREKALRFFRKAFSVAYAHPDQYVGGKSITL